ncbi:hypothetical protein AVEN_218433-1 [Araneus ventricosus]|uniref:F-box domain-containing protein n=1 Tax=Araneus ventricosus TaxID=182803 RepID=A0A4Y2QYC2_ARAVE|nr:hypothetical protein AVEN_218433-1 [Araneus ventricosus]
MNDPPKLMGLKLELSDSEMVKISIRKESLYCRCLVRLHLLLATGNRNVCTPNLVAYLPTRTINDLAALSRYHPYSSQPKVANLYMFLSTGRCTFLDLGDYDLDLEKERDMLLKIMSEGGFRSLRFLNVCTDFFASTNFIGEMICSSPQLEEFHSGVFLDLDFFKNCKKLRCLRLFDFFESDKENLSIDLSLLKSLKKLEVFHVSNMDGSPELVATVLENCPNLISLGIVDSLDALEIIYRNAVNKYNTFRTDGFCDFFLRRCLWGMSEETRIKYSDLDWYKNKFPEKVKIAVSLCPLVEELVIRVYHKDSFEYLKNLKKLSFLCIDFKNCDSDYLPAFISLLQKIGSQLKHLFLDLNSSFPVETIFDYCPNLEALQIGHANFATAGKPTRAYSNVSVKKLSVSYPEKENLLFLVGICKRLTHLVVDVAPCLDDALMRAILNLNSLAELEMAGFRICSLSKDCLRMFLGKATSLKRLSVRNNFPRRNFLDLFHYLELVDHSFDTADLISELKLNVEYVSFKDILTENFFTCKLSCNIF